MEIYVEKSGKEKKHLGQWSLSRRKNGTKAVLVWGHLSPKAYRGLLLVIRGFGGGEKAYFIF